MGSRKIFLIVAIPAILLAGVSAIPSDTWAAQAKGWGIFTMKGFEMPGSFTFESGDVSCSAVFGTLGAPGPGPFSEPHMKLEKVNFGMVMYSVAISKFEVMGNRVSIAGTARSITSVNEKIVENALYSFTVEAADNGSPGQDVWSMKIMGSGLMFDGAVFETKPGVGLTSGDVVIGKAM